MTTGSIAETAAHKTHAPPEVAILGAADMKGSDNPVTDSPVTDSPARDSNAAFEAASDPGAQLAAGGTDQASAAQTRPASSISPWHVIFISAVHIGTVAAFFFPSASGIAIMFGLYVLTGLGITVGYHRLLSHRAFSVPNWLRRVIAVAGCLAMQGGPLRWVADHREHHADSDSHGDPHDITRGFAFAHFLWLFYVLPAEYDDQRIRRRTRDLASDPFLDWLERYHAVPGALVGVALLLIGGLPWLLWGFCARLVLLYHATWLVNSAAHLWGPQPFPEARGTNNWVVAALTFGEGWHNNHHAWPVSARQGLQKHQVDVSWLTIRSLRAMGLARHVVTVDFSEPGGRYVRS